MKAALAALVAFVALSPATGAAQTDAAVAKPAVKVGDRAGGGKARNVIWYVPEVRRWAKSTLEITTPRGVQRSGEELVAFELQ